MSSEAKRHLQSKTSGPERRQSVLTEAGGDAVLINFVDF